MNISDFKAGEFTTKYEYRSFVPDPINKEWNINNPEINILLEEANLKLGELNAFSTFVPDVNVFIRMHMVKEATHSSRIEGSRIKLDEALLAGKDISPESRVDWKEVQNYIQAMDFSIKTLENLPLSSRVIKEAHRILLKGSPGRNTKNKLPGEFRTSQKPIGSATIKDPAFVPPHHSLLEESITDLEKFLNNDQIKVPHLIRIGIAHYQFIAIFPFLEGNGRISRLLTTLYLLNQKVLHKPTLYLSDYLEKNWLNYSDNLMAVSYNNKMEDWLKFFLKGVIETAKKAIDTFPKIIALRDKLEKETILSLDKPLTNTKLLLTYLYCKPVITVFDVIANLHVTKQPAKALIADLCKLGILKEQTGYTRTRIFVFDEYLKLFEG